MESLGERTPCARTGLLVNFGHVRDEVLDGESRWVPTEAATPIAAFFVLGWKADLTVRRRFLS